MNVKLSSSRMALCGVTAALAVVIMSLGSVIPFATFCCPILAMLFTVPIAVECPKKLSFALYGAIALLALLLAGDKEASFLYLFLGYYPFLRPSLEKIRPRILRLGVKHAIFTFAVVIMYLLLIFVFRLDAVAEELQSAGAVLNGALLIMGNIVFYVFDLLLFRFTRLYSLKWRKRLFE